MHTPVSFVKKKNLLACMLVTLLSFVKKKKNLPAYAKLTSVLLQYAGKFCEKKTEQKQQWSYETHHLSIFVVLLTFSICIAYCVKKDASPKYLSYDICMYNFSASMPTHSYPPLDGVWDPTWSGSYTPSNDGWKCVNTETKKSYVQISFLFSIIPSSSTSSFFISSSSLTLLLHPSKLKFKIVNILHKMSKHTQIYILTHKCYCLWVRLV